jgi:Mrp family chromosome partitioning ATPase
MISATQGYANLVSQNQAATQPQQALALLGMDHAVALDVTSLLSLPTVAVDLSLSLPTNPLVALHQSIRKAIGMPTQIVQFASAYDGEDASRIAFEMALVAGTIIGKRVLFIDTGSENDGVDPQLAGAVHAPLDLLLQSGGSYHGKIVTVAGTRLSYATLRGPDNASLTMAHPEAMRQMFENLRQYFELIVIDSAGIMSDVFGTLLARQVDGTVLVVASERTRAPVVEQTRQVIENSGGRVIGTVLSRRQFHIPLWLYRLFYRRGR